jgi:hypothetical protein
MSKPLTWRIMADDELLGEGVPIYCKRCVDTGTIPADPIFVNTASHYGVEYRSEEPCPDCSLDQDD